ncbi:MAG: hypothetical protein SPJ69_06315 [Campylobacter sp.]|nr:hypothetical protein [Campylobacter sp.]MDD7600307.1 hypothetical protein [Campylobacteraceae bacterium]MDY5887916.1 hypothetical protein [Campylobacter sp.]
MKETAEMTEFCAKAGVCSNIVKITGEQINQAWRDVVAKKLDIAS